MSEEEQQGADTIVKGLSCCFPIVGIILYFIWKDSKPQAAKDVCNFALIGFGIGIALNVISMVLGIAAGTM